ncbi:MAG: hypothetical protein LHW45_09465, partial [Candidatus Cloacimonetes bacterium]|nr:hypothetical protein [Candidatus Cloacimonadota bacterium]MDY0367838.1 hypothetical protein [Candidatus Syntrophosphaera sp.]
PAPSLIRRGKARKKGKVDRKKEINRNADDRIDRINGIYKTEGQRDRVMYHKLQLVGCPRFISRHKDKNRGKEGQRWILTQRIAEQKRRKEH